MKKEQGNKELLLGGQAVIEGVMMKSERNLAVAVRQPNQRIKVKTWSIGEVMEKHPWLKWPFIRGITNLVYILGQGMKALYYSANQQLDEQEKLTTTSIIISLGIALALAFFLFKFIPLGIAKALQSYQVIGDSRIVFNLIDGFIRILIFLGYIGIISFMQDVKLLFQYHGAEHKTVNCFEAGKKLTVKNVKPYPTLHQRCGTSFLLLVQLIAILVFSLVPVELPFYWLLVYRLPLILPIASIAYELLKLSAKYPRNPVFQLLIKPGLFLQKITTSQPTEKQIQTAIKAAQAVIRRELPQNQRKLYI